MIKNDELGKRLNSFKEKNNSTKNSPILSNNPIYDFIALLYTGLGIIIRILAFGYTAKILFNMDWNFLTIICIGFTFNFLLTYIYNIFHD
jgi:hypothetical protein